MDFKQNKKINKNEHKYHFENLKIVRNFSKELILEFKNLVKSIVVFGSNTQNTQTKNSDIDIMIILDNVSVFVTPELREAYRIITEKISSKYPNKIHLMTVNFSDFWDMSRKGDPVLINILRHGLPIYDTNLIEPMQYLLEIGRIKPSRETVLNYQARSKTLLEETEKHLREAILDLYYCAIDIMHSSLMIKNVTPPSPKEMPTLFKKTFHRTNLAKYSKNIEELYKIAKKIEHNTKTNKITGAFYDKLKEKTQIMVNEISEYIEKELKEKDQFEL